MSAHEIFHAGEIAVQERAGERAVAMRRGSMIGDRLTDGARAFLGTQALVAVAAAGPDGALWASLWAGTPGFLRADEQGERVAVSAALDHTLAADPVRAIIRGGVPLGMLAIDLATRRRLRINGTISRVDATGLELHVREAFGNCPKYIQRRQRSDDPADGAIAAVEHAWVLDDKRRDFIARTDTLFVASIHPQRGVDVSHRGGEPGFVQVHGEQTLRIPDYPGNAMFQTLGNFEADPRAGLALIDFERRRILSLSGNAIAAFGADDPGHPSGGTGRYWSFTVERWVEFSLPSMMTWTLIERSPFNPPPSDS
jgi:predicted pyridoxine 5'-phosphate oxidase superfamily flavin-nucleotide-binding protein